MSDSMDLRSLVRGVLFDMDYGLGEFADDTLDRHERRALATDLIMEKVLEVGV
jgi:hypothetical protein